MIENLLLIFFLTVALGILVWVSFNIIGEISAVAFVPSNLDEWLKVMEIIKPKQNEVWFDLGSGDGRVIKTMSQKYGVVGVGYEINPWLCWWSKWKTRKITKVEIKQQSLWQADIKKADGIYCYLSPRAMKKLGKMFSTQGKNGLRVISKAFEMKEMKHKLQQTIEFNQHRYFIYRF